MDKTVSLKKKSIEYSDFEALGAYIFTMFNEETDEDRDCQVIVFKGLKSAYVEFIGDINHIFRKFNLTQDSKEDEINNTIRFVKNEYFKGYDLSIGYNEEDIKDIFYYYNITGCEPEYIELKDSVKIQANTTKNHSVEAPVIIIDGFNFDKLSMSQIKELDEKYWRELRDKVFEKYIDEEGNYVSATGDYKSSSKWFFEIDHIVPLAKGGKTVLENLQLLTRWENRDKGDKMPLEFLEEKLSYSFFEEDNIDKSNSLIKEILIIDEKNIFSLNLLGRIKLWEDKYTAALINANKVLKFESDNIYALITKGYAYYCKENYIEAIKVFERTLGMDDEFEVISTIADCYNELKKKDIALGYYHKAIELEENNDEVKDIYFNMASIYFSKRKYELAYKYYEKTAELEPENHIAINNLGVCQERLGNI